ncbi:MAG: HAMP domain-containing histidine kinase [Candidatus Marinimicrobia bacterium]|nr:HAMP domain-containing histidine kinase [Candidatus Neomarinimicrobiota bacterium]
MFSTSRIKLFFTSVSIIFIFAVIIYSHTNIRELRNESRKMLSMYTEVYAKLASNDQIEDFSFIFDEIIDKLTFPIIITAKLQSEITAWKNIPDLDDIARLTEADRMMLVNRVKVMDRYSDPFVLEHEDLTIGYIHYGDSRVITRLKWLPYIEILGATILILLAFWILEYVRSSEKKFIWVGMAKETAHQLGTPISSLMGWLELAKERFGRDSNEFEEMDRDIERLEKVSHRFSQIGSKTKRKALDITQVILTVYDYMNTRIPQKNSRVELLFDQKQFENKKFKGNAGLLEWALENLIKNALDALEGGEGTITVSLKNGNRNRIIIDVSDTGKGISEKDKRIVFRAGFSTKKRGWGLGLSLTQRIIEDYHSGKIYVLESTPGLGTTFRIEL